MLLARILTTLVLGLLLGAAAAGSPQPEVGSGLSAGELARIQETAAKAAQAAKDGLVRGLERHGAGATDLARRVDDIASAALSAERDAALRLLGIDPQSESALYYFVSWSMPEDLLRAYVIDAMWTGGTLVFKGVPPGRDLKDFLLQDLQRLVYGKGAWAALSIDPRLFDAFRIQAVPAIVLSSDRANLVCTGKPAGGEAWRACGEQDPARYWKMSGAVTSHYALTQFKKAGAGQAAAARLAALAKGAGGKGQPREQSPFRGDWQQAITPEKVLAGRRAVEAAGRDRSSKRQR